VLTNSMIFYMVFVFPKHFAIDVDCGVGGKPTPPHIWVLVGRTYYVQEVRGHMEIGKGSWLFLCNYRDGNNEIFR
jgi:hypothetical protein